MTRREFLYYVWAASMALFMGQTGGGLIWFALPRFREGEFGGAFDVPLDQLPHPDDPPAEFPEGRFWLVNIGPQTAADPRHPEGVTTQTGLIALYKVCVHLGCLYQWNPTDDRFRCPCHASQYLKDGTRIRFPAARDLDQFSIQAINAEGNVLAANKVGDANSDPTVGQALTLPTGAVAIRVDTGKRLQGRPREGPGTVE